MKYSVLVMYICSMLFPLAVCAGQSSAVEWETFNGGFFTIHKPQGWQITVAGECSMFSFIISDPQHPVRRVFYFGQVGPFYLIEQQRVIDYNYIRANGFPVQWINMPVVYPLTAENFFRQFYLIARDPSSQNFIRGVPLLQNFQVVSAQPVKTPLANADTKIVRGVFSEFNTVGEGLFYASVAPYLSFDGMNPGVGTGIGFMCTGISSYKNDFAQWEPVLTKCLQSLAFSPMYLEQCKQSQDRIWQGIGEINKTWNEISDIIDKTWEYKKRVDDACAEKFSDTLRGVNRMRDSETGEVYEVPVGTSDKIEANNGRYGNHHLEPLANNDYDGYSQPVRTLP